VILPAGGAHTVNHNSSVNLANNDRSMSTARSARQYEPCRGQFFVDPADENRT
jgi:hypothetical protein